MVASGSFIEEGSEEDGRGSSAPFMHDAPVGLEKPARGRYMVVIVSIMVLVTAGMLWSRGHYSLAVSAKVNQNVEEWSGSAITHISGYIGYGNLNCYEGHGAENKGMDDDSKGVNVGSAEACASWCNTYFECHGFRFLNKAQVNCFLYSWVSENHARCEKGNPNHESMLFSTYVRSPLHRHSHDA